MCIMNGGAHADISYDSVYTAVWSYIECGLGVAVACTLSIPKLIKTKGGKVRAIFSSLVKSVTSRTTKRSMDFELDPSLLGSAVGLTSVESKR
jgi:hypothetical protein